MNVCTVTESFYGKDITIETGKLAKQADGAVTVRYGDTVILATVVSSKKLKTEDQDFFPLSVDYRERVTAMGRFRGGYMKRETKATQKEILVSRLTDRPLRPLFEDGFLYDVMVEVMVVSADQNIDPDVISIIGASSALSVSSIPFHGPVGGVRVGRVNGELIINPSYDQEKISDIDIMMAGNRKGILMVEGSSKFIKEDELLTALDFGYEAIKKQLDIQDKLIAMVKPQKNNLPLFPVDRQLMAKIKEYVSVQELKDALYVKQKAARSDALDAKYKIIVEKARAEFPELNETRLKEAFKEVQSEVLRKTIINEGKRADGRGTTNIRDIWIETSVLPRTHGSAVFTRGETQALGVITLGGDRDCQKSEDFGADVEETFYVHYTFPGYSVGEVKPSRGPGRREIGHGELAQRALTPIIPEKSEFPYVIRYTSDILESNGSSSMATVCAGTLSLMDAGVPIKAPVAGIAMGLIMEEGKTAILSDILGLEDSLGDMDFKVAGTKDAITAVQMDIKVEGITKEIMKSALLQAKEGRNHILGIMEKSMPQPKELSSLAPRIIFLTIPQDKIGLIIGPGGKNIKSLCERFDVVIDINDDGNVSIKGEEAEKAEACKNEISLMTSEIEVDKVYKGIVKSIVQFGAFIECIPGKEALLHISRISNQRINKVEDVLTLGQAIEVKCIDIDEKGRPVLSRKDLLKDTPEQKTE